jgi:hypothetical protein
VPDEGIVEAGGTPAGTPDRHQGHRRRAAAGLVLGADNRGDKVGRNAAAGRTTHGSIVRAAFVGRVLNGSHLLAAAGQDASDGGVAERRRGSQGAGNHRITSLSRCGGRHTMSPVPPCGLFSYPPVGSCTPARRGRPECGDLRRARARAPAPRIWLRRFGRTVEASRLVSLGWHLRTRPRVRHGPAPETGAGIDGDRHCRGARDRINSAGSEAAASGPSDGRGR